MVGRVTLPAPLLAVDDDADEVVAAALATSLTARLPLCATAASAAGSLLRAAPWLSTAPADRPLEGNKDATADCPTALASSLAFEFDLPAADARWLNFADTTAAERRTRAADAEVAVGVEREGEEDVGGEETVVLGHGARVIFAAKRTAAIASPASDGQSRSTLRRGAVAVQPLLCDVPTPGSTRAMQPTRC